MSVKENGKGAMAWGVILTVMLAGANAIGGFVWKSVTDSNRRIVELSAEVATLREQMSVATKNRWSATHQRIYNSELNSLNASIKVPDVRRIIQDYEP